VYNGIIKITLSVKYNLGFSFEDKLNQKLLNQFH